MLECPNSEEQYRVLTGQKYADYETAFNGLKAITGLEHGIYKKTERENKGCDVRQRGFYG